MGGPRNIFGDSKGKTSKNLKATQILCAVVSNLLSTTNLPVLLSQLFRFQELNPQVSGGFSAANAAKFTEADYQQLLNFSIVIGTNLTEDVATRIGSFLYEKSVPFIHTRYV